MVFKYLKFSNPTSLSRSTKCSSRFVLKCHVDPMLLPVESAMNCGKGFNVTEIHSSKNCSLWIFFHLRLTSLL